MRNVAGSDWVCLLSRLRGFFPATNMAACQRGIILLYSRENRDFRPSLGGKEQTERLPLNDGNVVKTASDMYMHRNKVTTRPIRSKSWLAYRTSASWKTSGTSMRALAGRGCPSKTRIPFAFCADGAGHWRFHESQLEGKDRLCYNQNDKSKIGRSIMADKLNGFQREFLKTLADIQEGCVQTALGQDDDELIKGKYYEITSEVIIRIMEIIDGYWNQNIGKLNVTCEKSGESLKAAPYIELHDIVCNYLKGTD